MKRRSKDAFELRLRSKWTSNMNSAFQQKIFPMRLFAAILTLTIKPRLCTKTKNTSGVLFEGKSQRISR